MNIIYKLKKYAVQLLSFLKRYPRFWVAIAVGVVLYFVLTFVGGRVIEFASNPKREVPQSKLSGIVCQNYERRPIAVMLANDSVARPLSGVGNAELVFEMPVTPDGITRIMAVYQCNEPDEIGSVRSARDSFIGLALGIDAIYAYWGGEAKALEKLDNQIINNIDALKYEGSVFYRKKGVRAPHNGFTDFDKLWDKSLELGYRTLSNSSGFPRLNGRKDEGEEAKVIRMYGSPYNVEWFYDEKGNIYNRFRNGLIEKDSATNQQVEANVVVTIKTTGTIISQDYLDVDLVGSGEVSVYQNGRVIHGTWIKESIGAALRFINSEGNDIKLMPGITWIEIDI